jgi:hypothetical protein
MITGRQIISSETDGFCSGECLESFRHGRETTFAANAS